jgi:hypothetical protein
MKSDAEIVTIGKLSKYLSPSSSPPSNCLRKNDQLPCFNPREVTGASTLKQSIKWRVAEGATQLLRSYSERTRRMSAEQGLLRSAPRN